MFRKEFFWLLLVFVLGCRTMEQSLLDLKSQYSAERIKAIVWIYENTEVQDHEALLKDAIQDKSEVVRSLAVRLMGLEEDPKYIDFLLEALKDPSPLVRMEAVQNLGYLKAEETIPDIKKLLSPSKEGNLSVRLKVLKSLEYMNASQELETFVNLLDDMEPAISFQAMLLLEKFTGKSLGMDKEDWKEFLKTKKDNTISLPALPDKNLDCQKTQPSYLSRK